MKATKLMIIMVSVSLFSLSRCQKEEVSATSANLTKCDLASSFDFLLTINDEEGTVEEYVIDPNGAKIVTYVVKNSKVPTGYLAVCNLPEEFKQVGIRLKFSASVYQPKNMKYINLNAVPTELTSIQNVTPSN